MRRSLSLAAAEGLAAGSVDVHYSSGVGSHFSYPLSEGSGTKPIGGATHSSTTCNGSTVSGIGRDAAGKIITRLPPPGARFR